MTTTLDMVHVTHSRARMAQQRLFHLEMPAAQASGDEINAARADFLNLHSAYARAIAEHAREVYLRTLALLNR